MRARRLALIFAVLLCSVGARRRALTPPEHQPIADIFTASNSTEVTSTHLSLDLTVDFNTESVRGSVTHTLVNPTGAQHFIVDTNGLVVDAVKVDGKAATWMWNPNTSNSAPLGIDITPQTKAVRIEYHTSVARGLHWLKAQETRTGTMPAMWSENEPDLARTWIPLQDTPTVRVTYDATIHAPSGEMALMSAANNPTTTSSNGIYTFTMPHPIPSYLIALTVGRYDFRAASDRTGVYAEPNLLDATTYETKFVPDMLAAAERVIGPYPFERYDLVFPPKYVGGMENPELNFIGQDMITGNFPAVVPPHNLVAHEMAHSWFGDRMTCAQWNDLWLNEGFANYFSGRVEQEMGAVELAEYIHEVDRGALDNYLALNLPARSTVLHRTFVGSERPAFTIIYYQKGEVFLHTLEDRMGRAAFDAFIARYEQRNGFHWVDDFSFRSALVESVDDPGLESDLMIDDWIYGSGLPSNVSPKPESALGTRLTVQANAFRAGKSAAALDTAGWGDLEFSLFLTLIPDVIVPRMNELDSAFGFSHLNTPPLGWLNAAAKSLDAPSRTLLDRVLAVGRSDSLSVWYTLSQTAGGRAYAVPLFNRVRTVYDPNTRQSITGYLNAPLG